MPLLSHYSSNREAGYRTGFYIVTPEGHGIECAMVDRSEGVVPRWDVRFADGREYEGLSAAVIVEALEEFAGYTPSRARRVAIAAERLMS